MNNELTYALIIPTYFAGPTFDQLLKSINDQGFEFKEKIVIDSSSTDGTLEIAKKYSFETITVLQKEFDHGGTRNFAFNQTTSDIVIFITQDIILSELETFSNLVKPFSDPKVAITFGRQIPHDNANFFATQLRNNNYPTEDIRSSLSNKSQLGFKTIFCSNSFAAYRRSPLIEIGGFKNGLLFGEDAYASGKIINNGYSKVYCSKAIVKHSHNYTITEDFKRYFDIGVFHEREKWLLEDFGQAQGEGLKYVKKEILQLLYTKKIHLIPSSFFRNLSKFVAYKVGRNHQKLSLPIIKKLTMNQGWWTLEKMNN